MLGSKEQLSQLFFPLLSCRGVSGQRQVSIGKVVAFKILSQFKGGSRGEWGGGGGISGTCPSFFGQMWFVFLEMHYYFDHLPHCDFGDI